MQPFWVLGSWGECQPCPPQMVSPVSKFLLLEADNWVGWTIAKVAQGISQIILRVLKSATVLFCILESSVLLFSGNSFSGNSFTGFDSYFG